MYNTYFGLKEKPFKLVPNPEYLFLSKSHEEAFAHLSYATRQGDGFVAITGEVGTGKTTLCRAFLDSLDDNIETAFIFNPRFNAIELLQAINTEFGIPSHAGNTKDLIDILNIFLLKKKAQQRNVIVLVDEAQSLSTETLEMLRMLSNLETTRSKLLQIILVGQPELADLLETFELRQLGQRINLSCHLLPLNYKETCNYIRHRINIASHRPLDLFSSKALKTIYRHTAGIPRKINIACDRALLTAFSLGKNKVTNAVATTAIQELIGRGQKKKKSNTILKYILAVSGIGVIVIFTAFAVRFYYVSKINSSDDSNSHSHYKGNTPDEKSAPVIFKIPATKSPDAYPIEQELEVEKLPPQQPLASIEKGNNGKKDSDLFQYLTRNQPQANRLSALKVVLAEWVDDPVIESYVGSVTADEDFFRITAKQNKLSLVRIDKNIDLIERMNLPTVMLFFIPGEPDMLFLTLTGFNKNIYYFTTQSGDPDPISAPKKEVRRLWAGIAFIPWKNYLAYSGVIPTSAPKSAVITLKMLLQDIGFDQLKNDDNYDDPTRLAVKEIQAKYGLPLDGRVGPLTKIAIYQEKNAWKAPYLNR
jgi:general secretion pathway protein A